MGTAGQKQAVFKSSFVKGSCLSVSCLCLKNKVEASVKIFLHDVRR